VCEEGEVGDFGIIDSLLFIIVNSCSCSACQGFSKGTLHYMKNNAHGDRPFNLNKHVKEQLKQWDTKPDNLQHLPNRHGISISIGKNP